MLRRPHLHRGENELHIIYQECVMLKKLLKLFLTLVIFEYLMTSGAIAGGLALSGVGSRAISMGGAFRGLADDWSACYWNPAGLANMEMSEFNGMLTIISPRPEYNPDINLSGYDILGFKNGTNWYTKDKNHIFPSFSGFFKIPGIKGWTAGLGIYIPFGTGAEWDIFDLPTGYNNQPPNNPQVNYPVIDHKSDFSVIDFHPTVAKQIIENELSFGAGISIQRGDVTLQKVVWSQVNPAIPVPYNNFFTDLELSGDGWGIGGNEGLLYKLNEKLSIGLAYRSPVTLKINGSARTDLYTPYNLGLVDLFNSYNTAADSAMATMFEGRMLHAGPDAKADVKLPADYGLGVAYRFTEKLTATADINYTNWARLDNVPIDFTGNSPLGGNAVDDTLIMEWENTTRISLGLEYRYSEKLAFRAGYFNDPSPIPDKTFTPLIPDIGTKNSFNVGAGWDLGTFRIDYNFEYIKFSDRNIPAANYQDADGDGTYDNYPGIYKMDLFASFISITHRF